MFHHITIESPKEAAERKATNVITGLFVCCICLGAMCGIAAAVSSIVIGSASVKCSPENFHIFLNMWNVIAGIFSLVFVIFIALMLCLKTAIARSDEKDPEADKSTTGSAIGRRLNHIGKVLCYALVIIDLVGIICIALYLASCPNNDDTVMVSYSIFMVIMGLLVVFGCCASCSCKKKPKKTIEAEFIDSLRETGDLPPNMK